MKKFIAYLPLLLILCFHACEDTSSEIDYNPNVQSSRDYIRAEDAVFEIVNAFLKAVNDTLVQSTGYAYIDDCDVAYNSIDHSLVFGYGTDNRLCEDLKYRRGRFIALFNGPVFEPGSVATLETDSLFVDDYPLDAKLTIEHTGQNPQNRPVYNLKLTEAYIMLADTTKVRGVDLAMDFSLEWAQGHLTPEVHEDDVYMISGTASGVSTDNYAFSIQVTDPLKNEVECFWISSGKSSISVPVSQVTTGDIDYVTQDQCNNYFLFFFDGNQFFDIIK